MTEKAVSIPIPSDLYAELENVPIFHGNISKKIKLDLSIGMFISKKISLSRAAEYADMNLVDFTELLNNFGVPVVNYSSDMFEEDLAFVNGMPA